MSKPFWDTSIASSHPALASIQPTAEELEAFEKQVKEANSLANSPAQKYMTRDQQFLEEWERQEKVARGSLEMFCNPLVEVDDRNQKISEQKLALGKALYKLGRYPEVFALFPSDHPLVVRISEIIEGIHRPDSLEGHQCERETATVEANGEPIEIALDRRSEEEEIFSPVHGIVVKVWKCNRCGELNATPETPARQQRNQELLQQVSAALKKKQPIPPALRAENILRK